MSGSYDITALGELLIDFAPVGTNEQGSTIYEANPGGAPCNVLAMAAKWGKHVGFIGKVGDDLHGRFLRQAIIEAGIDASALKVSDTANTTLAFVSFDSTGDRSFSFYRNPGADMDLSEDEVDYEMIRGAKIFHFGTLSMTHEKVRAATAAAIRTALESGCVISFDPNYRPFLWKNEADAIRQMAYGASVCDILKIEIEELRLLTGISGKYEAVKAVQEKYGIPLILVTEGAQGSEAFRAGDSVKASAVLSDDTIDTTGAGDTYYGYCLSYLLDHDIARLKETKFGLLTQEQICEMLHGAAKAASIITTRKGALKVMPGPEELL